MNRPCGLAIALVLSAAACGGDGSPVPTEAPHSAPKEQEHLSGAATRSAQIHEVEVLSQIVASGTAVEKEAISRLTDRIATMRRVVVSSPGDSSAAIELVQRARHVEEPTASEALNIIYRDPSFTFTKVTLSTNDGQSVETQVAVRPTSVYIVTGAILGNSVVGLASPTGGSPIAFSGGNASPIWGAVWANIVSVPFSGPNCFSTGGSVTATTTHTASYTWQFLGAVFDSWQTQGNGACSAKPPASVSIAGSISAGTGTYAQSSCPFGAGWVSSNPFVASVSENGYVYGVSAGTAFISSTCFPIYQTGTAALSVTLAACNASSLIFEVDYVASNSGTCATSTGNGGHAFGDGTQCHTEWTTIEIDYGFGWQTYWTGYATWCEQV